MLVTLWGTDLGPQASEPHPMAANMVTLGRQDLDVWLGEPEDFVLAVLRDIYENDAEVRLWLHTPRPQLGGQSPTELLSRGRTAEVESILVEEWNSR